MKSMPPMVHRESVAPFPTLGATPAAILFLLAVTVTLTAPTSFADELPGSVILSDSADKLRDRSEPVRREGAQALLRMNNVPAAELLLEFLGDENPHTRDIVWEVMPEIRDPYARKRVELEMRRNKHDPHLRQWCAEALGHYGQGLFGEALRRALGDRDEGVRRAAARSLGMIAYEPAARHLEKTARHKDPYLRANSVEALARIDAAAYRENVEDALADKAAEVRCAVLAITPELYPDDAEAWSSAALRDEDWRPRMQAVDNFAAIRTKTSIDALIAAIDDGRPVVAHRAVVALQQLTRQKWTVKPQWELWWGENRAGFSFPRGKHDFRATSDAKYATYNKVPVVSDHVVFLMDKSQMMRDKLKSGMTKDERALEELENVFARLSGDFVFNVYNYADQLDPFQRKPVTLNDRSREAAIQFVMSKPCSGRKDIWNALLTVVEDPDIDTVYLLSSGEPEIGLYVHWNRVVEHLADVNRFHKLTVHSVAYSSNAWYRTQLEKIATATGGEFVYEE